jgi:shikimate kinase
MTVAPSGARPVFLIGSMGAGKSTVGRRLAQRLGAVFVDLDDRLEILFGAAIPELFAAGEPEFRRKERSALVSLLAEPGFSGRAVVVATGGGIVLDPGNVADLRAAGWVVFLDTSLETRALRLDAAPGDRPLLAGRSDIRAQLRDLDAARRPIYESAAHRRVDGDADPDVVATEIVAALAVAPGPHT